MPGLIALVARGDDLYVDVVGTKAFGDEEPMTLDATFHVSSLTKPIAAVAAMALVEDGTLRLNPRGRPPARAGPAGCSGASTPRSTARCPPTGR